jgi:hypothetical protein
MPARAPDKGTKSRPPLPPYSRIADPPAMRLTERDKHILEAIHDHDGMLSHPQVKTLFFGSDTQLRTRMALLFQHGYVNRPSRKQRAALSHMIYWLGEKGAAYLAGQVGERVEDFSYRKEPRFLQVEHDLAVNDVRIAITQACEATEGFDLIEWLPEGEFHAYPDKVEFTLPNGTRSARNITPDSFFTVERQGRSFRFLLELDNRTSDNPRFAREKVIPGLAYLKSEIYKKRFGATSGQWLVVTTGERRLKNLKRQTEQTVGENAKWFYFTTLDRIRRETVLTSAIWYRGGDHDPMPLFKP